MTVGAQGFFTDETPDSDVAQLLAPHATALITHVRSDDSRILDLVRAGAGVADEAGVDDMGWPELYAALDDSSMALTARPSTGVRFPGIFDAGENTVDWIVEVAGKAVVAVVRAAIIGPDRATGIGVQLRSGAVSGASVLDADGRATLPLVDSQQRPMTESAAWDHDWTATSVVIGAAVTETRETRERVRRWVRARLDRPGDDALLAEILASESAY